MKVNKFTIIEYLIHAFYIVCIYMFINAISEGTKHAKDLRAFDYSVYNIQIPGTLKHTK